MSKVNLIESQFDLSHHFEAAVLCTYGLDLDFLENYLLALRGLSGCDTIALFVDAATYEEFVLRRYVPRHLNRRYLVTPIRAAGVFHSKLYLLASPQKVVMTVGSANLTREGIAGNLELLTTMEVSETHREFAPVLRDALEYARRLAELSGSQQALNQINEVAQICSRLVAPNGRHGAVRFVHNLDRPILDAILTEADGQERRALVLSPFYDTLLAPLASLQEQLPDCPVEVFVQQKKSNFPTAHLASAQPTLAVRLYHDLDRYLHGKAIILEGETDALVYTGSANFTRSALLTTADHGNYEIGLLGRAPKAAAQELLQPLGSTAMLVRSPEEIEINDRIEPPRPRPSLPLNYLLEAVQENSDTIRVQVNPDISSDEFRPRRYRLVDFNGAQDEGPYRPEQTITRSANARRLLQGTYGVQLIGKNSRGETVESNRVWVIALEERSGNTMQRALRRIADDPTQLIQILQEIAAGNDEREMMLFLAQFDVPLDLALPGITFGRPRTLKSKGNLVGGLPFHKAWSFSSNIVTAFESCIRRLLDKMKKHLKHPQPNAVGNFVLLYCSVLALLIYLNEWARKRYEASPVVSSDDWRLIRDCYDMLIRYTAESWDLAWSKGGYRNVINSRLDLRREEAEEVVHFEGLLLAHFDNSPAGLVDVLEAPLKGFEELHSHLKVSTPNGLIVQPKIFPTAHPYLQEASRQELWTQRLRRTQQMLGSGFQPVARYSVMQ